jgi:hypothetical protein
VLRRLVTALAATAAMTTALVAAVAAPAAAADRPPPSPELALVKGVTESTTHIQPIQAVAGGVTTGVYANGLTISATCTATATSVAASVSLTTCRLVRGDGLPTPNHPAAGPANTAVSSFTESIDTTDFELCYDVTVLPVETPSEPAYFSGCAPRDTSADLAVYR